MSTQDRATVAFVHRKLPVPKYTLAIADGALTIETSAVRLTYTVGQPFNEKTLLVAPAESATKSKMQRWTPGASLIRVETPAIQAACQPGGVPQQQKLRPINRAAGCKQLSPVDRAPFAPRPTGGNLLGTIRSLDKLGAQSLNCTLNAKVAVHGPLLHVAPFPHSADQPLPVAVSDVLARRATDEGLHCEWGLASRDGWSLVDDSTNWALTPGAEWWDSPNSDDIDWYLFAYRSW